MKEELILQFNLKTLQSFSLIDAIVSNGYQKTGCKFSIEFNGSKGYLSNFSISCEGVQKANNRILLEQFRNKTGSLKAIGVNVYYSLETGVRLTTGLDEFKKRRNL